MSEQKFITIAGKEFEVSQPFAEGHALTAGEARAMNQVFAENIRNNMAMKVKAGADQSVVTEYANSYVFSIASGAGSAVRLDPVEREALRLAKDLLKARLGESGRKFSDFKSDDEKAGLAEKIASIAALPKVLEAAKKAVAASKKRLEALAVEIEPAA